MVTTTSAPDPLAARPPREGAILDAAIEVVSEVGYERTTMDAVAARAHASKATIYRHWPGKAELVTEALSRCLITDETLPDTGSLRGDLCELARRTRDFLAGPLGDLLFGVAYAARSDETLRTVLNERLLRKPSTIDVLLAQAESRGEAVRQRPAGRAAAGETSRRVGDIAPAMVMLRMLAGDDVDDAWLEGLVDDVLLPLLTP